MLPPERATLAIPDAEPLAAEAEPEARLFERLRSRDSDAIGEAYARYGSLVFSYALRTVGNRQDAEEILQDTFVRLWEKAAEYRPDLGRPYTWVFMITRGLCLDRLRRTGRHRRRQLAVANAHPEDAAHQHAWPRIISQDELRHVRASLRLLAASDRQAVEMAVFLECTGAEIADHTHEPLGTVKTRVRRGLARLRQLLRHSHD
ncbi:MAG: sigma-70 family RNA polymerase sigma factor [Verrucomicrobiales bacterium]